MGDFKMPALGAEMESGTLVQWKVKPGDQVKRGDIIAVVDTDKAAVEVEIWESGTVEELLVKTGSKVPVGTSLARISSDKSKTQITMDTSPQMEKITESGNRASPAARKLADDLGVDLSLIKGTGPNESIILEDIEKAEIKNPTIEPSVGGMRKAIAAAMERSNKEIPHYYLSTRINLQRATQWLDDENLKRPIPERILMAVILLKSVALACKKVPEMNGVWKDGYFQANSRINIGVAISLRQGGLISPAIIDIDQKPLPEIMKLLQDLVKRTRSGSLRSSELSEGTITVSNLGDAGAETLFGVIYPPQVALVGFGEIFNQATLINEKIEFQPYVNASLAADHRASDGHRGAIFIKTLNQLLQEPEKL